MCTEPGSLCLWATCVLLHCPCPTGLGWLICQAVCWPTRRSFSSQVSSLWSHDAWFGKQFQNSVPAFTTWMRNDSIFFFFLLFNLPLWLLLLLSWLLTFLSSHLPSYLTLWISYWFLTGLNLFYYFPLLQPVKETHPDTLTYAEPSYSLHSG